MIVYQLLALENKHYEFVKIRRITLFYRSHNIKICYKKTLQFIDPVCAYQVICFMKE